MSSSVGAGPGASAFKTSLNLSTTVPTSVVLEISANRPSVNVPSSGSPILIVPPISPEPVI